LNGESKTDYCVSSNTLREYYCEGAAGSKYIGQIDYDCQYGCENGACHKGITVLSPNGGEQWKVGETHTIKWETNFQESTVGMVLYDESLVSLGASASKVWQEENIPNTGSYSFTVPQFYPGIAGAGINQYKIYIDSYSASGYSVSDYSDNYFSITQALTGCDARNISVWNWDYCTPECPCDAGEGDCDKDSDCITGYCANNVGANYGQTSSMDVCEEKITTVVPICTDTDGGKDYFAKGATKGLTADNLIEERTDYCSGDNVIEWYCSDEYRTNTNYTCPYGCSNGACIGRCPDINNDNVVNYLDLAILTDSMDYCSGDNDYNNLADLTGDGCVNDKDTQYLQNFDYWLKNRSSIPVCLKLSNVWDIDDNGFLEPEIDGKIIQRYLFEIRGDALLGNGVGANANRDYNEIIVYLDYLKNAGALDIDSNGQSDGGSDSVIMYRYMAGFTGSALIKDAVASNAIRTSASAIQTFLECENDTCLSNANPLGLNVMEKQLASASDAISQIIENLKELMRK